jgi:putative colanic acid biosynthesis glycosyltransferase
VIGLHNLHGYYLNVPLLFEFLRRSRIPILWTLHDCWSFTGHCSYFDRFNCRKWQTECRECPMTAYYPRSLVDRSTRNHRLKKQVLSGLERLAIVTPSEWLAAHVRASFLSDYPVQVIPNGIDLERFRIVGTRAREVIVLGVANRWDDRKGLADFIELRSKISAEWRIVLVGLNPAERRRLPENIEGLSRTESVEELVRLYSQATVYVNPTYADNFPTTNIEALACGTPVVTYRTGGSPEAVTEGCGAVVEVGDVDGLAKAIEQYAAMDQGAVRTQCRARAEREYSDASRYGDYVELCEALVSGTS